MKPQFRSNIFSLQITATSGITAKRIMINMKTHGAIAMMAATDGRGMVLIRMQTLADANETETQMKWNDVPIETYS